MFKLDKVEFNTTNFWKFKIIFWILEENNITPNGKKIGSDVSTIIYFENAFMGLFYLLLLLHLPFGS